MSEVYNIIYQAGKLDFLPSERKFPEENPGMQAAEALLEQGWIAFCHFGDPELMHCSVYRKRNTPGGIFIMKALDNLFMAHTDSNLVFSMACGHFAALVADIRYGTDIWEEAEDNDD